MIAILGCALLLVFAAVVVGRTTMLLLGWRRPEWLAGGVGLAALVSLAPFLVRLPGRGLTAAILLALLILACAIVTRRAVPSRRGAKGAGTTDAPRAQHAVALAVVAATIALASLPFLFNERTGVLGEGIYTNDHAAQLYWTDWLAEGVGPQPNAVAFGYPVGPQALVAALSKGTGADAVTAFNGLLLAIPALAALAALSALVALPPGRRVLAAVLAGLPFLAASFLAQSAFKETAMGVFVLAFAVTLHLARRDPAEQRPPLRAVAGVLVILAAASVFTFSLPGLAWFGLALSAWLALAIGSGEVSFDLARARAVAARHQRVLVAAGIALAAVAILTVGPASAFIERIDEVQASSGRLASPVFPGEALGIWPEGDFRIVRGEVSGALLATTFAAICALGAGLALLRHREWGLLATLGAAAAVYAMSRPVAQIHVEAKALAVLAPIAMLVTVRWLLEPARERSAASYARLATGAVFVLLAFASTLLALRAAPVGFDERQRGLERLAARIGEQKVAFLGVDRFAAYYLRGAVVRSPGGYVPSRVGARPEKVWQQGRALDFDTLEARKLDRFRYAVTTAAGFQSTPPPNWREVAREDDYVLWRRHGKTPPLAVLPGEGGDPGEPFDCDGKDAGLAGSAGRAVVLERPAKGKQEGWAPGFDFAAPGAGSQEIRVAPGEWRISLQYHSQVSLTVRVDGEPVGELPPSLEGFYLVGAGRGAYWPTGEVVLTPSRGERRALVEVEVEAARPSALQRALGVERRVWLGGVALSSTAKPSSRPLEDACGEYVDHYLVAE